MRLWSLMSRRRLELIVASRPDVIVKGGDYNVDTVVGAQEVMSWGGQVRIVPTVEGYSTTRLIEKGTYMPFAEVELEVIQPAFELNAVVRVTLNGGG
jgi:hypothetical protein